MNSLSQGGLEALRLIAGADPKLVQIVSLSLHMKPAKPSAADLLRWSSSPAESCQTGGEIVSR